MRLCGKGSNSVLIRGPLRWRDQAGAALCSAAVPRPAASSFMPLRRAPHRPDPQMRSVRKASTPLAANEAGQAARRALRGRGGRSPFRRKRAEPSAQPHWPAKSATPVLSPFASHSPSDHSGCTQQRPCPQQPQQMQPRLPNHERRNRGQQPQPPIRNPVRVGRTQ